ncbi:DUF4268 domain-containing protein [Pseudonocardia sulfidoxydans]|uniref:DUF4268 domain-containing protein n=1 Tax=Pseudonocardia sulfidoxydans TaxID=54011 RepID=UPI001C992805|nr:DUF4268 domain-containing protein [Pseudonocardia sulfidoxydans]
MSHQGRGLTALGRLAVVPAREVWPHEAFDFTPWLLQNVDVLSDLLGMDLVLEVAEHPVGDFSLDLKGYDELTGETVIVENQLAQSDHNHLGQIITYAAGTNPTTIVWITTGFRLEHRAAIDWLNQRTDDNTRVFGVVIRVVRIGTSEPAPNFELVAQPNDWEKQVKKATSTASGPTSAREAQYREFWELVLDRVRAEHPDWTRARTSGTSWVNTATGTSGAVISMAWTRAGLVIQIYFESADADLNSTRFDVLYAQREIFEAALGETPVWDEMDGRKAARIVIPSEFTDLTDKNTWPQMIEWLIQKQNALRSALAVVGGVS